MWFLSFIPDAWLHWFVHGVVLLGIVLSVAGTIGKSISFIAEYGFLVKAIGSILLLVGIFFEGGYGVEMSYRAKVAEMEAKVKVAEQQSKNVNKQIETKVVEKVKIIKEQENARMREIEKNRSVINFECKLSDAAWMWYNRASQNDLARSTNGSTTTSK
jgi:hypothetical protein